MFEHDFANVSVHHDKGFGVLFDFTNYADRQVLGSPYYYADGLGTVERDDGADLVAFDRGGFTGVPVPGQDEGPNSGLWIKTPGVGWLSTIRVDMANATLLTVYSCRSRDASDLVQDVTPTQLLGRRRRDEVHLHSFEATHFFLRGGDGEGILRFGSFVNLSGSPAQALKGL